MDGYLKSMELNVTNRLVEGSQVHELRCPGIFWRGQKGSFGSKMDVGWINILFFKYIYLGRFCDIYGQEGKGLKKRWNYV